MCKITVVNKFDLRRYEHQLERTLLIRVTSIYPLLRLRRPYTKDLAYFFDDSLEGDNLITPSEAKEIIDEVINGNYDEIIISCDYGVGRSPAIAFAISEILNIPFNISKYPSFNKYVYHAIKKAYNEK